MAGVNGKIILKCMLQNKFGVRSWTGLIWLGIGADDGVGGSVDVVMNSYEFSDSTKFGEYLDRLRNHWLSKKATVI